MKKQLFLTTLSVAFMAYSNANDIVTITGKAQGTTYSVKYWQDEANKTSKDTLKDTIDKEFDRIDKIMSNYRPDSNIEQFNSNKQADVALPLDKEILNLLEISAEVHQKSNGCYDPTIGPLFKIWGFKKDALLIPTEKQIKSQLQAIGFATKLRINESSVTKLNKETTIGLSAIGQGYAVEQISKILNKNGINDYITEIGGEMLVSGKKPNNSEWKVGVERPIPNSQKLNEIITVTGKRPTAIMTSGTYRHYFDKDGKRYSHILNPRNGKPVEHNTASVTVLHPNGTFADAWSTALLCLGSKDGLAVAKENMISAIFYDVDGKKLLRQESEAVSKQSEFWKSE